jgi:hypothetical protein
MIAPGVAAARHAVVAPAVVPWTIGWRALATIAREAWTFAASLVVAGPLVVSAITAGPVAVRTIAARPVPERTLVAGPITGRALAARAVKLGAVKLRPIKLRAVKLARPAIAFGRSCGAILLGAVEFRSIEFRALATLVASATLAALERTARTIAIPAKAAARLRSVRPLVAESTLTGSRAAKPLAAAALIAAFAARRVTKGLVTMSLAVSAATDLTRWTRAVAVGATLVAARKALAARRAAAPAGAAGRASPAVSVIVTWHIKSRFEVARLITEFAWINERPPKL